MLYIYIYILGYVYVCVPWSPEKAQAILHHAHQSSVYNGGKMRQAETRAHQNSEFNIMLCLAHEVNERRRAIN